MINLRTKMILAIVIVVIVTEGVAAWAMNDRIMAGAERESRPLHRTAPLIGPQALIANSDSTQNIKL